MGYPMTINEPIFGYGCTWSCLSHANLLPLFLYAMEHRYEMARYKPVAGYNLCNSCNDGEQFNSSSLSVAYMRQCAHDHHFFKKCLVDLFGRNLNQCWLTVNLTVQFEPDSTFSFEKVHLKISPVRMAAIFKRGGELTCSLDVLFRAWVISEASQFGPTASHLATRCW